MREPTPSGRVPQVSNGVEAHEAHGYSLSNGCTDHGVQRGGGPANYHTEGEVGGLDRHLDLSLPPCDDGEAADGSRGSQR